MREVAHDARASALQFLAVAQVVVTLSACAANELEPRPFVAGAGVESGPSSGLWGDTSAGPHGMQIGCISGRRLTVVTTVHNRAKRTVTLLGAGGPQLFPRVIERVAIQVRLAPPERPNGRALVIGMRPWNPRNSPPVAVPPGRDAWLQSNFLMRNCKLLRSIEPVTVNRSTTLSYRADRVAGRQIISIAAARIILTRGPRHPTLPINQVG
jgi:hypothetical protein